MLRVLIFAIPLILAIYALIDCVQTPEAEVRGLPKLGWVALIVLIWVIGPVAWLLAGRERGSARAAFPWPTGPTSGHPQPQQRPPRIVAPDDDPEFLRQLGTRNTEHEAMLEQWERDLRRREGDMRGDKPPPDVVGDDATGDGPDDTPRS
jgi:hypothetical protein